MKAFNSLMTLAALVTVILTSACSAHIDGGSTDIPAIPGKNTADKVAGPSLDGSYKSKCNVNGFGAYQIVAMTVTGHKLTRTEEKYSDALCTTLTKRETSNGDFVYMADKGSGIYEVEYHFDLGGGWSSTTGENIKLDGSSLWVSGFAIGDGVVPTIELLKIPAPTTFSESDAAFGE